jgi:topoisomerase IA-like protein
MKNQNLFDTIEVSNNMVNFEKVYQRVATQVIRRCHGAIKITKHGKIIEVYDTKRHIWSDGLAGLIIKEESRNANLREWEVAKGVRPQIIAMLLEDKKGLVSTRLARASGRKEPLKKATQNIHATKNRTIRKPMSRKSKN